MWIFGAFSLFYFSFLIESANEKKFHKYSVCKTIEKEYGFKGQNLGVENLYLSGDNSNINGMEIMRRARFILYFLYFFTLLFLYFGWKLNYNPPIILYIILIIAISLGWLMERTYKKKCPVNTPNNLKKKIK